MLIETPKPAIHCALGQSKLKIMDPNDYTVICPVIDHALLREFSEVVCDDSIFYSSGSVYACDALVRSTSACQSYRRWLWLPSNRHTLRYRHRYNSDFTKVGCNFLPQHYITIWQWSRFNVRLRSFKLMCACACFINDLAYIFCLNHAFSITSSRVRVYNWFYQLMNMISYDKTFLPF